MHALHPDIAEGEKRITTRERVQSGMRAKGNQEGHTIQHVQQRPVDQRSTSMVRKEGSVPVGESSLTPPQVSCLISYVGPEMFFPLFLWFLFV